MIMIIGANRVQNDGCKYMYRENLFYLSTLPFIHPILYTTMMGANGGVQIYV
jgi:hypothetical protein